MSLTREPGTPFDAKFEVRCGAHQKASWVQAARARGAPSLADWVRDVLDADALAALGPHAFSETALAVRNYGDPPDDPPVDTEYYPRLPRSGHTLRELVDMGVAKEGDMAREVSTGLMIPITREALAALDRADLPSPPEGSALSSAPGPDPGTDPAGAESLTGALTGEPGTAGELPHEQVGLTDSPPEPGSPEPLDPSCTNAGLHWRLTYGEQCHYCKGVAL